ncbi:hypothetical protein C8Q75DRAFT_725397 [Abortiporus biennis]|nr:hypothetical protein C8Q75DRAFT_725397 [Abortiporus biennis]
MPINTLPSFDNLASTPPQNILHPPIPPPNAHDSPVSDRSSSLSLPKVGETRCYWSILDPNLHFLYLDPVLASHLHEQADLLIGRSLLQFVHPDEQTSAQHDLRSVLDSKTSHGSVTRVRYSRLSRVRRLLGYQGPMHEWTDANKVAIDANYLAIDIVINWVADGLVLCFMHAVVDLNPRDDDEINKTGWTNWCGTPYMSTEQAHILFDKLAERVTPAANMNRVFQILLNVPERTLWFTWPLDSSGNQGPTAKDFAKIAEEVQIGGPTNGGTDAKTSCTRRYKAIQTMYYGTNGSAEVESIFIPYGSIIFACHQVTSSSFSKASLNGSASGSTTTQNGSTQYGNQLSQPYYGQQQPQAAVHSYSHPPPPGPSSYSNNYLSQMSQPSPSSPYSSHNWTPPIETASNSSYSWSSHNVPVSSSPVSSLRSSSYPPPPQSQPPPQWSSQPPHYVEGTPYSYPPPNVGYHAPTTQPSSSNGGGGGAGGPPSPGSDIVPASRIPRRSAKHDYTNGGRSAGNPPNGISKCSSCKVTHSPEWRKGPSGKKDLCNACGLRYARSRAKKEGATQRRKKDRVLSAMSTTSQTATSEHSPSASPVTVPYSGLRRSSLYDDSSFMSTSSAGSASGNEPFPHHANFDGMTPSPSPPSGGGGGPVGFLPYSYHPSHHSSTNDQRAGGAYTTTASTGGTSFYSIPPPNQSHSLHNHHQSRLDPILPYPGSRLSPILSPPSPADSESPMSANFPNSASFERERHDYARDTTRMGRGMVPTPDPLDVRSRHPGYLS